MKVFKFILNLFFIFLCVYWLKLQCREAYKNGYYTGFSSKICTLGFRYLDIEERKKTEFYFKWVGVGNEEFDKENKESLILLTGRKSKYWWAE